MMIRLSFPSPMHIRSHAVPRHLLLQATTEGSCKAGCAGLSTSWRRGLDFAVVSEGGNGDILFLLEAWFADIHYVVELLFLKAETGEQRRACLEKLLWDIPCNLGRGQFPALSLLFVNRYPQAILGPMNRKSERITWFIIEKFMNL